MRHMLGVLLAVVMGAAVFFGAGWGISRIMALSAAGQNIGTAQGVPALGAVLGTGLLLGILLAAPGISPLGSGGGVISCALFFTTSFTSSDCSSPRYGRA